MIALERGAPCLGNTREMARKFRSRRIFSGAHACGKPAYVSKTRSRSLDFRVEVEKRRQAGSQLFLDIFLAALEHVHGDVRLVAVLQFDGSLAYFDDLIGR